MFGSSALGSRNTAMRDTNGRGLGMGMDDDEDENDDGAFGFGGGRKKRFTAAGVDSDEEDEGFRKGPELKQDTVSLDQVCLSFLLTGLSRSCCGGGSVRAGVEVFVLGGMAGGIPYWRNRIQNLA